MHARHLWRSGRPRMNAQVSHRLTKRTVAIASLLLALAGFLVAAAPARAQVHDNAGIFSKDAIAQATQSIEQIKQRHNKNLLIETYPRIPDELQADYQALGKQKFFEKWAND